MANATAIFLSSIFGASLLLAVTPGCSSSPGKPAAAVVWNVNSALPNTSATCGTESDSFTVGDTTMNPIVTVSDGSTANGGVPVTVQCSVTAVSTGFEVNAYLKYGNSATLTIIGTIATSGSGQPGTQTGITGQFGDFIGLKASMTSSNCTVTFTGNPNMGVAATRIWGYIDCPNEAAVPAQSGVTSCDGNAQFLFENCSG